MKIRWPIARLDRDGWLRVTGGVASVVVATVLFTRFTIDGSMSRDESIYVYGGQQLSHGVAPYDSIFDPKTPIPTVLAGFGAWFGRLIGYRDVYAIRLVFLACSVLAVLAMYLLVQRMWRSVLGGLTAAVILASYDGFARDALPGPDAKTPGVLFLILCMWLAARRNWLWAGVTGSLAFLVWQPFLIFPAMAVIAAGVGSKEKRLRALGIAVAGVLIPIVVTFVYFAAAGAFGKFVESTFEYPLTGVKRINRSLGKQIKHIVHVVNDDYAFSGVLFWIGALLLLALLVGIVVRGRTRLRSTLTDPVLVIVGLTGLFEFGYALADFQSYPDVYPLLAYPAIGIGAVVALVEQRASFAASREAVIGIVTVALTVLTVLSAYWFTNNTHANNSRFNRELASGCALQRVVLPGTPLYAIGSPVPLVLTHRRNPDRYIYLDAGVGVWKVKHTSGGLAGWEAQIKRANPSVVVMQGWTEKYHTAMWQWLVSEGYNRWFLGGFRVFVKPEAFYNAESHGVQLTKMHTEWPLATAGGILTARSCENG